MNYAYWAQQSNLRNVGLINSVSDMFLDLYSETQDTETKDKLYHISVTLLEAFAQCNKTGRHLGNALSPNAAVPTDQRPEVKKLMEFMREVIRMEDNDIK